MIAIILAMLAVAIVVLALALYVDAPQSFDSGVLSQAEADLSASRVQLELGQFRSEMRQDAHVLLRQLRDDVDRLG